MTIVARVALDVVAELEDGADFSAGEIGDGAHVFACETRGGGENVLILLRGDRESGFEGGFASHCCGLLWIELRSEWNLRWPHVQ
jgi:hypothetical protein